MKNKILVGVILAVLIIAGVIAWYILNNNKKPVAVPASSKSESVIPNSTNSTSPVNSINPNSMKSPIGTPSFSEAYKSITQAQKDCLVKALGQAKLDGFLKNDIAVMQTVTGDEYAKASACSQ